MRTTLNTPEQNGYCRLCRNNQAFRKGRLMSVFATSAPTTSSTAHAFYSFAAQVAEQLPEWDYHPDDTGWGQAAILKSPEHPGFVRIAPAEPFGGYARRGQVRAHWIGDHGTSHIVHATIETGPVKVAGQIHRRLMCGIDQLAAHQAHAASHVETRRHHLQTAAAALSNGFPIRIPTRLNDTDTAATLETQIGGNGHDTSRVKIRCVTRALPTDDPVPAPDDMSNVRVEMNLNGLTYDQAIQVRGLLSVLATTCTPPESAGVQLP